MLFFTVFTHTVYAQEETDAKQAKSNSDNFEVILVSAQKRDQALKEVPFLIEVLSGDLI